MSSSLENIQDLVERYYDGLYRCDTTILKSVFHPEAQYYTNRDGALFHLSMDEYFPIIESRTSPLSQNEPKFLEIKSMELAGSTAAQVHLQCRLMDIFFTDFLSLLKLNDHWWIVSKTFHGNPITS